MDLKIKEFEVLMELKNKGIELEVRAPAKNGKKGEHRGDLCIGKGGLEWCKGQTPRGYGKKNNWDQIIAWFES